LDVERGAFSAGLELGTFFSGSVNLISCFFGLSPLSIKSGSISSSELAFGFGALEDGFFATDGASFGEDFGLSSGFLLKNDSYLLLI
jgi:hypothetical protein